MLINNKVLNKPMLACRTRQLYYNNARVPLSTLQVILRQRFTATLDLNSSLNNINYLHCVKSIYRFGNFLDKKLLCTLHFWTNSSIKNFSDAQDIDLQLCKPTFFDCTTPSYRKHFWREITPICPM